MLRSVARLATVRLDVTVLIQKTVYRLDTRRERHRQWSTCQEVFATTHPSVRPVACDSTVNTQRGSLYHHDGRLACQVSLPVAAVKPTNALPWCKFKVASRFSGTIKQGSCVYTIVKGLEGTGGGGKGILVIFLFLLLPRDRNAFIPTITYSIIVVSIDRAKAGRNERAREKERRATDGDDGQEAYGALGPCTSYRWHRNRR